jgi:hypothetical protein
MRLGARGLCGAAEGVSKTVEEVRPALEPRLAERDGELVRPLVSALRPWDVGNEHRQHPGRDEQLETGRVTRRAALKQQIGETAPVGLAEHQEQVTPREQQPGAGTRARRRRPLERSDDVAVILLELVEHLDCA